MAAYRLSVSTNRASCVEQIIACPCKIERSQSRNSKDYPAVITSEIFRVRILLSCQVFSQHRRELHSVVRNGLRMNIGEIVPVVVIVVQIVNHREIITRAGPGPSPPWLPH